MARPRKYDEPRVQLGVRLPETLHSRLTAEAAAREVSTNLLVQRAIEQYLDRLPPVSEVT